ncbi:MAG: hypothetical protein EBR54_03870 [Flavobacteriia bacterium]|nr:hypothetical protein [Flavobacteriia bacterium]NBX38538.1 hypothetical protein [Flavobacteriia bacterium]
MKVTFLFFLLIFAVSASWGQKSLRALNKVYSKSELTSFKQEYGSLDLLEFAYDHAIHIVKNNGNKDVSAYPKAQKTTHFTELNVKILPYTQYFQTETPGELLAVMSLYQLQLALNEANKK